MECVVTRSRKVGGISDGKISNSPLVSSILSLKWEAVSSALMGLWRVKGKRMLDMRVNLVKKYINVLLGHFK